MFKIMRNIFFIISIFFFFQIASPAYACDPLGCLLSGKDQDILAIVTIQEVNEETVTVIGEHYYEESKQAPRKSFIIDFKQGAPWVSVIPQVGEHYFVSLACEQSVCFPKWGVWQVDGIDYQTTQFLHVQNGDDAAVEWFVNGKGSNFYGMGENMYARTDSGDFEIYPEQKQYLEILEKTNQQLGLWTNPYGVMVAVLSAMFAVLAIAVAYALWQNSREQKEIIKQQVEENEKRINKMHEKAAENFEKLIEDKKNQLREATDIEKEKIKNEIENLEIERAKLPLVEPVIQKNLSYCLSTELTQNRKIHRCSKCGYGYLINNSLDYSEMLGRTASQVIFGNEKGYRCPSCGNIDEI